MTDKPTVHEALAAVMGEVQAVRKADRNTQQGYNFRGIDAVVNAVGPALRTHGVVILPVAEDVMVEHFTTKKETQMRGITLRIRWRIYGPAGDSLEAVTYGEAADSGDKAVPKAHSVAYRTMLLQALCIPTDEPDPDSQSYERGQEEPPAGPDQRNELLVAIKARADDLGWSKDDVKSDFSSRCDGKDIVNGTQKELEVYLEWLVKQPSNWETNPVGEPA
jgi:ERF superfamily